TRSPQEFDTIWNHTHVGSSISTTLTAPRELDFARCCTSDVSSVHEFYPSRIRLRCCCNGADDPRLANGVFRYLADVGLETVAGRGPHCPSGAHRAGVLCGEHAEAFRRSLGPP